MIRRLPLVGFAACRPAAKQLLSATLVLVPVVSSAQVPEDSLRSWWPTRQFVRTAAAGEQDTSLPIRQVSESQRHTHSVTGADAAHLRWWEDRSTRNDHQAEEELNWWSANSTAKELGWWNVPRPTQRVATRVQDNPFGPQPADQDLPSPSPEPQVPRVERPNTADINFDPFAVVPRIRPLSEISASLQSDPVPEGVEATEPPPFTGTAEEYLAQNGSVFLAPRVWPNRTPEAAAYQFYSRPLWYEDANLERCGYTVGCLQPVVSGTYFFANTALLPYRFAAEPQCTVVPQKSFCAPGCRYTHRDNYLPPWSPAGAVAEAAAVTGLVFLIP